MEAVLIGSVVRLVVTKLTKMIEEDKKLRDNLKKDLRDIKLEMQMMNDAIVKYAESKDHRQWILEVQELAYDVEDCIDLFEERVTHEAAMAWHRRKYHQVTTMSIRSQFAKMLTELKERAVEASRRRERYLGNVPKPAVPEAEHSSSSSHYTPEAELVGIEKPKAELLELLRAAAGGEAEQLRVIIVLGPRGIGKTALARAVFDAEVVAGRFPGGCAWVVASEHRDNKTGLQAEILRKLQASARPDAAAAGGTSSSSSCDVDKNLKMYLEANNRYFIVIDDMQTSMWDMIKSSFPEKDTNGRIIVTTSVQSIANTCSSNLSNIYRMQALSDDHSKELLSKNIFDSRTTCPPDFMKGSESILKKCDGLPLGLVNIAHYLRNKGSGQLTRSHCIDVCSNLGSYIHSDASLERMKKVLIHSYDNLPRHDLKTCLLSVSIYPKDQPIKKKSLVRRWLAEGFISGDARLKAEDVARGHFEELINRSIIQPVDVGSNSGVKTCQLHSIMLDFIVHKSASENFISLIHDDEVIHNTPTNRAVRRLSLYKPTEQSGRTVMQIGLSRIRSLTIFDHVGDALVDFHSCKLLRVLDLENCMRLQERDLDGICKMLQLKYLSLRGTDVSKLPREISKLHHLEIFDIRGTRVNILPKEVLNLPQSTHLFGQFELPCEDSSGGTKSNTQCFFSEKSKLQTLAGIVMDDNGSFRHIMHMRNLRKVKIRTEKAPNTEMKEFLVSSLRKRLISDHPLVSLSVNFGEHTIDFLDSLNASCALTSIKLLGKLSSLPKFVTEMRDLSELNLLSTGLNSEALSTLQDLQLLNYLKLSEVQPEFGNGKFIIQKEGFPSLQRLCIQAKKLPQMGIAEGAMKRLYCLQLICEDISGLHENAIKCFDGLKEVTLADSVGAGTRKSWEEAVKKHKNRPIIRFKQTI